MTPPEREGAAGWSREAPTKGWWWLRESRWDYVDFPVIVEVVGFADVGARRVVRIDTHDSEGGRREVRLWNDESAEQRSEWFGPLPTPPSGDSPPLAPRRRGGAK